MQRSLLSQPVARPLRRPARTVHNNLDTPFVSTRPASQLRLREART